MVCRAGDDVQGTLSVVIPCLVILYTTCNQHIGLKFAFWETYVLVQVFYKKMGVLDMMEPTSCFWSSNIFFDLSNISSNSSSDTEASAPGAMMTPFLNTKMVKILQANLDKYRWATKAGRQTVVMDCHDEIQKKCKETKGCLPLHQGKYRNVSS